MTKNIFLHYILNRKRMSNNFMVIQKFFENICKITKSGNDLLSIYNIKERELKNILQQKENNILNTDIDFSKIKI